MSGGHPKGSHPKYSNIKGYRRRAPVPNWVWWTLVIIIIAALGFYVIPHAAG